MTYMIDWLLRKVATIPLMWWVNCSCTHTDIIFLGGPECNTSDFSLLQIEFWIIEVDFCTYIY